MTGRRSNGNLPVTKNKAARNFDVIPYFNGEIMIANMRSFKRLFDMEKPTDIELALRLLQLMNAHGELTDIPGHANERKIIVRDKR